MFEEKEWTEDDEILEELAELEDEEEWLDD